MTEFQPGSVFHTLWPCDPAVKGGYALADSLKLDYSR